MTQDKALAILKSGHNVFLTGSAGTGKTYVLNQYIEYLQDRKIPVAITASTGIAATHIGGMTIHAWSGIGIKDHITLRKLQSLREKKYMRKKMDEVKVLIIDEISMLHQKQFTMVDEVLQYFKENNLPFGGIQVVISGDFFQLPPIGNEMETSRDKFAFMSPSWVRTDLKVCYLTEQYRQTHNDLNRLLNEIRAGNVGEDSYALVNNKIQETMYSDVNRFPQLYTHNADVDKINTLKINELEGDMELFKATTKGNKILSETLSKSVLAPPELILKEGAEVMFVRNNYEKGFFNGTLGTVREFTEDGFPLVETKKGDWIEAKPETWQVEDETGKVIASYTQIPLRLAWAITIHKSQGMTLDQACVDLRKTFEKGQGYVALSRLRDFDGLTLLGVNDMAMAQDELAYKADQRFLVLSDEVDAALDIDDLKAQYDNFIIKSGGKLIKEGSKKSSTVHKKPGKKLTHIITKEMLEQGKTPEEIAKERDYAVSTIYGHLNKVKDLFPDTDFSAIKVDAGIIENVQNAVEKIDFEGDMIKLKPIYDFLNETVSYEDIRKALLKI
ncbi:AAA family ATPase [Flavobacteriaceae bacterium Ap0902]|nr:AAA family ATPase [Flavobacteriaceae bacterium Ap0902]